MDETVLASAEDTAVYASEGLDDIEIVESKPEVVVEETKPQAIDLEELRASLRQEMAQERQAEAARQAAAEQARVAAEARAAALAEERELIAKAEGGDLDAQEQLYKKALEEAQARQKREELDKAIEPERAAVQNDVRRALWEEYAKSFGIAPDDKDVLATPAEQGMRGLNAALIRRTTDEALLEAARENPAIKRWLKEELEKGGAAASAKATAKALGSDDAPRAEVASGTGKVMTAEEIDRALMQNPDDPALYKAWVKKERAAGRYW